MFLLSYSYLFSTFTDTIRKPMKIGCADGVCSHLNHVLTASSASDSACSEQLYIHYSQKKTKLYENGIFFSNFSIFIGILLQYRKEKDNGKIYEYSGYGRNLPVGVIDWCDEKTGKEIEVKPNTLGFNISSLVGKYSAKGASIDDISTEFLRYILDNSDKNILLIPHVTKENDGDQLILSRIAEQLGSDRVSVVSSTLTAAQYKSIISRCDMFIGARTHATIAAYSTCVPTLVIGYSVKSRGIAKDIFGTDDGLVVPVFEIDSAEKLIKAYEDFSRKKEIYRKQLEKIMPSYIEKARSSINELFRI